MAIDADGLFPTRREVFALALALAGFASAPAAAEAGATRRRARSLGPGVNFSRWFDRGEGVRIPERRRPGRAASLGFGHVRLPVPPEALLLEEGQSALSRSGGDSLAWDVERILSSGLSVIVDVHPRDPFKARLFADPNFARRFTIFWEELAQTLARLDPERVLLEVLNEPGGPDPHAWQAMQGRLITAIRQGAPEHTIVACGAGMSTLADLGALKPYQDKNIVYSFHFYSPMIFTHQGASWSGPPLDDLRDVPFPLSLTTITRIAAQFPGAAERDVVRREAASGADWNKAKVASMIAEASAWSTLHGRPVICTEFGAFRDGGAPPADRVRYIEAVRRALDLHVEAWSHWDYSGGFGVLERQEGQWRPEEGVLKALGLRVMQTNEG